MISSNNHHANLEFLRIICIPIESKDLGRPMLACIFMK